MILTCRSIIVSYFISKCFVIVETKEGNLDKFLRNIQEQNNSVVRQNNDSILTCKTVITSIVNILKNIYIHRTLYGEYFTKLYDDHHVEIFDLHFKVFVEQHIK